MQVEIYNNHELLDMMYEYKELKVGRKFRGAAELIISMQTLDYGDSFELDNIAVVGDDAYFITGIEKYKDLADRMIFTVRGKHINSLLSRRALITPYTFTPAQSYEWHIQQILTQHLISPSNTDRKIQGFEMKQKDVKTAPTTTYKLENMTVAQAINTACGNANLGYKISYIPEERKYVFELLEGADKTQEVFFSEEFGNVANAEIKRDASDMATVCYLNNNGAITQHGTGVGLARIEDIIQGDNTSSAMDELNNRRLKETVSSDILQTEQFEYRADWDLGDTVTFIDRDVGFMVEKPVLEITEIYGKKFDIEVVFGERRPLFLEVNK